MGQVKQQLIIDTPREVDMEQGANLDNDPEYLAWTKEFNERFVKEFGLQESEKIEQDSPAF